MRAIARNVRASQMNKLEARYAQQLALLKAADDIQDWGYQRFTLKLADDTRYTPDFVVIAADGQVEFHETKGFMREDANVKLKVAAAQNPAFVFRLVRWKDKAWDIQTV